VPLRAESHHEGGGLRNGELSVMSISGVSSAASNAALVQLYQQRNQALTAIESAVQSGNISTAQQSLATLQQDTQTIQSTLDPSGNQSTGGQGAGSSSGQATGTSAQGAFASDLTALLQAVQSGNTATAQQDATAVQNDLQNASSQQAPAATSGHHHHHHHMGEAADSTSGSSSTTTTGTSTTSVTDPTSGTSSDNVLAELQALYSSNS
jgi:hypothetical protein